MDRNVIGIGGFSYIPSFARYSFAERNGRGPTTIDATMSNPSKLYLVSWGAAEGISANGKKPLVSTAHVTENSPCVKDVVILFASSVDTSGQLAASSARLARDGVEQLASLNESSHNMSDEVVSGSVD